MDKRSMLSVMERVLENAKVGILATVATDGKPRMRWMTPAVVRGREGFLYAVTSPKFGKAAQLDKNPHVEWMLQTKQLDEVVTVNGTVQIIDSPSTKADIQEAIGGNLGVFWKLNSDPGDLIVLETIIEEITYFKPISGEKAVVRLDEE